MKSKVLVTLLIAFITSSVVRTQPELPPCPPNGSYAIPYPGNCERFIRCINGNPIVQVCAPGLWFDQTLGSCNVQSETSCPYTTTTTTATPPTCPPIRIHPIAYPGYCDRYILCGDPVSRQCPPGLAFDPVLGECNDVHDCNLHETNDSKYYEQDIPHFEYDHE